MLQLTNRAPTDIMKNQVVTFMTFFQKPAFRRFLYFFVSILWCEGVVRAAAFGNPLPTVWLLAFTGAAAMMTIFTH